MSLSGVTLFCFLTFRLFVFFAFNADMDFDCDDEYGGEDACVSAAG